LDEFKLGWQAFVRVKPIVVITAATAVFSIAFMPLGTLFPFMTLSHFGRGGYSASLVEAVFAIGMIVGGLLLLNFQLILSYITNLSSYYEHLHLRGQYLEYSILVCRA
jgi:DHA3 family macrolide efflux protein-like MFS transporter